MGQESIFVKLQRIRKAVLGVAAVVVAYGAIALDALQTSDLSTRDGVISFGYALLVGYGIWRVPNKG